MQTSYTLTPIGYLNSCFPEKFGIPRQPSLAPHAYASLTLLPPFNRPEAVRGLEGFSHVWLQFIFHETQSQGWQPTVRPPRLGGNQRMGVFATRSNFRPNALGLSVVSLHRIEEGTGHITLYFSGVDLLDGTPIIDIKPYIPFVDSIPNARADWVEAPPTPLKVQITASAQAAFAALSEDTQALLIEVLQQDPRPAYHAQTLGTPTQKRYGIRLSQYNIRWYVQHSTLFVTDIDPV